MIAIELTSDITWFQAPGPDAAWEAVGSDRPPSSRRFLRELVASYYRVRPPGVTKEQLRRILSALSPPPHFLLPTDDTSSGADAAQRLRYFASELPVGTCRPVVWWWPEAALEVDDRAALSLLLRGLKHFRCSTQGPRATLLHDLPARGPGQASDLGETAMTPVAEHPLVGTPRPFDAGWPLSGLRVMPSGAEPVRVLVPPSPGTGGGGAEPPPRSSGDRPLPGASAEPPVPQSPLPLRVDARIEIVRYRLDSSPRPPLEDVLAFCEHARRALILLRSPAGQSTSLTGKTPTGAPLEGHGHAHFLGTDEDGDGRIDHLTLYAPAGFDAADLAALERLILLEGRVIPHPVRLTLEALGDRTSLSDVALFGYARRYRSMTPFSLPRFASRGAGKPPRPRDLPEAQLRRELRTRGLPEPVTVCGLEGTPLLGGACLPWSAFQSRREKGAMGYGLAGFRLEFAEPLEGPLILGFGCHFGLGLFVPERL